MAQLDVSQAAQSINTILEKLQQDLKNFAVVTQFSQNLRQKKSQWREYIEEVSTTITYIIRTERDAFQGLQLGYLGANQEEARQLQAKVDAFQPTINVRNMRSRPTYLSYFLCLCLCFLNILTSHLNIPS